MIILLFKDIKKVRKLHKGRNTQCTRMAVVTAITFQKSTMFSA
jgi:hypothetical protein